MYFPFFFFLPFSPTFLFDVVLSNPKITLGDSLHHEKELDKTKYLILTRFTEKKKKKKMLLPVKTEMDSPA